MKSSFSLFLSLLSFLRLNSFSLLLILSATAFFLLSLSFSFSLAAPSFFFLSLSLSLFLCIDHVFIFFFSSICFSLAKKRLWRWFLSCVVIIFFCSSLSYFFLYRLQLTLTKTCIWDLLFIYPFLLWMSFLFWFVKLTSIFIYVFSKDLMVSFVDLIFQLYKCLKWRVQPQTSFLTSKKPSLEMLFLFFLHFICSSCLFCLQASTDA